MNDCPCGSQKSLAQCCGPLLAGSARAQTPEQLMRSRYSAFALQNASYLHATHAHRHQNEADDHPLQNAFAATQWKGLRVLTSSQAETTGTVEFVAFYTTNTRPHQLQQLHELARFEYLDHHWYYTEGQQFAPLKLGRNDPCFCGSGLKLKKCCSR